MLHAVLGEGYHGGDAGMEDPQATVLRFNECINTRDLSGLAALMTDDHVFIDSADSAIRGKAPALAAWRGFFASFPDYENAFESLTTRANVVTVAGRSKCSFAPLAGPALWSARVVDGKLAEWRVYEDSPQNREQLGL